MCFSDNFSETKGFYFFWVVLEDELVQYPDHENQTKCIFFIFIFWNSQNARNLDTHFEKWKLRWNVCEFCKSNFCHEIQRPEKTFKNYVQWVTFSKENFDDETSDLNYLDKISKSNIPDICSWNILNMQIVAS